MSRQLIIRPELIILKLKKLKYTGSERKAWSLLLWTLVNCEILKEDRRLDAVAVNR